MKRIGMTLMELLIVVIILGVIAGFAIPSYFKSVERSRVAEAKANLARLRTMQANYADENNNAFGALGAGTDDLDSSLPTISSACNCVNNPRGTANANRYYFGYRCNAVGTAPGDCYAIRCCSGGHQPNMPSVSGGTYYYRIGLDGAVGCCDGGRGTCPEPVTLSCE